MSVAVDPGRLKHEMARRGWQGVDLAREARLSQATISAALSGKPVSARSLALIAAAFVRTPAMAIIDSLVSGEDGRAHLSLA